MGNRVISGAFKYGSIELLTKIIAFGLLPLRTFYLTPDDYGILGLMAVYSSIAIPLLMLGIDQSLFHRYHEYSNNNDAEKWRLYLSSNLLFGIGVALCFSIGIYVLMPSAWWQKLTNEQIPLVPYQLVFVITLFFGMSNGFGLAYLRAAEQHNEVVTIIFIRFAGLQLLGLLLIIVFDMGALGQLYGGIIGGAFNFFLLYFIHIRKHLVWKFWWPYVRSAITFGLPLLPHLMAFTIMNSTDRLMLTRYASLDDIGLFTFATSVSALFMLVVRAIHSAWAPRYYMIMAQSIKRNEQIRVFSSVYMGFLALFIAGGALLLSDVLQALTSENYHAALRFIGPLSLSAFFLGAYYLGANPLYFFKRTKELPFITLSGALINVLLNLWLIPLFGVLGAAYGTVVAYAFIAFVCILRSHQLGGISMPYIRMLIITCGLIALVAFSLIATSEQIILKSSILVGYALIVFAWILWPNRSFFMESAS